MVKQFNSDSDENTPLEKRSRMSRRWWLIIGGVLAIIVVVTCIVYISSNEPNGLKTISSQVELNKIYDDYYGRSSRPAFNEVIGKLLSLPVYAINELISNIERPFRPTYRCSGLCVMTDGGLGGSGGGYSIDDIAESGSSLSLGDSIKSNSNSSDDYSTTNIQVENVDEADITKTDGEYVYSLSSDRVIITDVRDVSNLSIASEIDVIDGYPIDLMLTDGKLVVIAENSTVNYRSYRSGDRNDTLVAIYNITDHTTPKLVKSFKLHAPYHTSRRIGNKLYVIASGGLRQTGDNVDHYYYEDGKKKDLALNKIHKLEDIKTINQTLMAEIDLTTLSEVNLNSYLIDIDNAYISENNIYLANENRSLKERETPVKLSWWSIFGWKGVWGLADVVKGSNRYSYYDYSFSLNTDIYKFNITDHGLEYIAQTETVGRVINQFSFDEYEGNLRVATKSNDGSRVVIFDRELNEIGASEYLARGEQMYASRFVGPRAYLVTYLVTDPLYVIDVSNPRSPQTLGELKIPGYSTYLHPYDENHLIGIGMDSAETTRRDPSTGRVISTSSRITGMKMALFDVSNVLSPKQISEVKIGDSRTTSAILTNHKALLFSKEKELIAIPVNNYQDEFGITESDNIETLTRLYTNYSKPYISEGYFVYNINLTSGITAKGVITHKPAIDRYYSGSTHLLRGLYIGDNLLTVSEDMIQANALSNLMIINQLNLIKE